MNSILEFIYETKITVQPENAIDILRAAKKFEIKELQDHIMENMNKYMTLDNFIGFHIVTKDEMLRDKSKDVLTFMIGYVNFSTLLLKKLTNNFTFMQKLGCNDGIATMESNIHGTI
jgi:hypothetical protein